MLCAELATAMITFIKKDDFIAVPEFRHEQANNRRHAACKKNGLLTTLKRCNLSFDKFFPRRSVASVLLTVLFLFDEVDHRLRIGKCER